MRSSRGPAHRSPGGLGALEAPFTLSTPRGGPATPGRLRARGAWGALRGPPLVELGAISRKANRRRACAVVGDDVDHRGLARGRRALQRGADLVRLLAILTVRAEVHR